MLLFPHPGTQQSITTAWALGGTSGRFSAVSCDGQISAAPLRLLIGGANGKIKLPWLPWFSVVFDGCFLWLFCGRSPMSLRTSRKVKRKNLSSMWRTSKNCSNRRDCGIAKLPLLGLRVVDFVGLWASEQQILPFKTGVNTIGETCAMYSRYIPNITHLTHWPGWGDAGTRQQLGQPEAIWASCRSTLIHRRWSALRGTKAFRKRGVPVAEAGRDCVHIPLIYLFKQL